MGTIPLPALDVRPPAAPPNMMEQYGQLMSLRNQQQEMQQRQAMAPLQQQAAQQQVQSGGLELQQRQQDLKDQQGISKWFMGIDPKDPDAFNPMSVGKTLASQGVSGKGIMAAQQQLMQHQVTAAALTKDQLANQAQMNDNLYSGINGIIGITDPQQRAQAMSALLPQAVQAKALQPQQAQQIAQNPGVVTDDQLKALQHGLGISSAFLASVARMQTAQTGAQTAAIKQPGEQATSDSLVLKNAAQQLAASPDQATYQAALGELPMKVAKNFPAQFDQQKVLQVGMTPAEVVTSQATAAQRQETNSFRQQALSLQAQNAQNMQAVRQQTEDAKGRKWVMGTDASGNMVAGPVSQLQSAGIQNLAELGAPEVKDIMNARHTINIATKVGDPSKPETMGTLQLIDSLDKDGKLGALASRYNKFVTTGVGASPGDDPRIVTLIDKNMLQDTGAMLAHFGASGGRSPQMLQHFLDLSNAGKMDGVTLRAGTKAIVDYMRDRAMMPAQAGGPPSQGGKQPTQQGPTTRPPGATHIVPGPDGKNHYTNATGTVDYGVAP